ncbi:MAG TPA: glycosyltransferase family 1 protein [Thermoanaerobaculia bacterium]|nr:glycosyltransferase family 1 protein [Thermoanaerobaculia bacterium]
MSVEPTVVQIVPELPPAAGGVAGYAAALAGALEERTGWTTRFLVPHGRDDQDLARELAGDSTLLLHYANYGYERRGCPEPLIDGLARWKAGRAGGRLVTVFHEVYASGPPWRSSFWLSPHQRRLAARLARLSDRLLTPLALYARLLARLAPGMAAAVAPVFSTVGEPDGTPGGSGRAATMAVFGGAGARRRAYGELRPSLEAACRELGIAEILDIGPDAGAPGRVDGVPVRALGVLPAAEVGARLLAARAGFLAYPPSFLAKSTIFAAYCAHGLVPVCAWNRAWKSGGDGPEPPPFWRPGADPDTVAAAAGDWYRGHSLARQAELYAGLLAEDRA